jgi:hypothetical protein
VIAALLFTFPGGLFAQSSPLTIQPSTGRVGIGTTTPAAKLHVESSGSVRSRIASTDASPDAMLEFYAPATVRQSLVRRAAPLP